MMKKMHKILSLLLALVMTLSIGIIPVAYATETENDDTGFSYEKLDAGQVSANLLQGNKITSTNKTDYYSSSDSVRAMVVLEEPVALFGEDEEELRTEMQDALAEIISTEVLDGEELDVVWNLTSVTNAMSVNVEYGKLEEIEEIEGVKRVFVETQYEPLSADTSNTVAQEMTAAATVKAVEGLSGAGVRVAVIDTGTDLDHQAFDNDAYLQSLKLLAAENGMEFETYVDSLDLLDVEDIQKVLTQLNAYERDNSLTAGAFYENEKLPFGFNYIDVNLDVTHDNDEQGSHGSHVAGIVAANQLLDCEITELDMNGDGAVTTADPLALMNYLICGEPVYNLEKADLSGDGTVSSYDVYLMLQMVKSYDGEDEVYLSSASTTGLVGVAPDAQLITMKVFGTRGGAYSSDYMAALEDAVKLGCDVVNLSLGNAMAGFSSERDYTTQENWDFINGIMEDLEQQDVVVCIAAGNSGNWADHDNAYQHMYTDEGGTAIVSTPATYTNALAVASADNVGSVTTCKTIFANDTAVLLSAVSGGVNKLWSSLDTDETNAGTTYDVVFLGDPSGLFYGGEIDETIYGGAIEEDLTGKIVLVARGNGIYFSDKHMNAANAGAAAVIIYNNVDEDMNVSIEGSDSETPCASITLDQAIEIYEAFGGTSGQVTISNGLFVDDGSDVTYPTMSSFSSWGAIGDLTIKPEITAPGGAIYSVEGTDKSGKAYEVMSGTSMASPHVAGLAALMNEYLERDGLVEKAREVTGNSSLTLRALSQSLMMSTATPMIEEASGVEYSVRNQGAGLANIQAAVNAETFLLVEGQEDGKVKAELGDGTDGFSFSFTVYNLSDTAKTYSLSSSILTTDTLVEDGHYLVDDAMTELDADVSMPATITVPAGGSQTVTVSLQVSAQAVAKMKALGYDNGFYVEGFIYLDGSDVSHSIPLLGWYGCWSDGSMYDTGAALEILYGTAERPRHGADPYMNSISWTFAGYGDDLVYTGNIYGGYDGEKMIGDQVYLEDRNAISSSGTAQFMLTGIWGTPIRAAAAYRVRVTDVNTGEIYYEESDIYAIDASFYYMNGATWYDMTVDYDSLEDWAVTDADGNALEDGTEIELTLTLAPEYYVDGDTVRWDELGKGTDLSFFFRVDNTAPDLKDEMSFENNVLTVPVEDNNYIAAVILLDGTASTAVSYYYPDMTEKGADVSAVFDLSDCIDNGDGKTRSYQSVYGNKAAVVICDYAGNETYYALNLGGEGKDYGALVGFQYDFDYEINTWVSFSEGVDGNETRMFYNGTNFVAAEYVGGYVFAQAEDGKLYGIPYEQMLTNTLDLEQTYIATLDNIYQDFAYSYKEGKLYGLFTYEVDGYPYAEIDSINLKGEYYDADMWQTVEAYQEDWVLNRGGLYGLGLAVDDDGTLYVLGPQWDWDTEGLTETAHLWSVGCDYNESDESWMLGWMLTEIGDTGLTMDYLQSMTWDHNSEQLYWARFAPTGLFTFASELYTIDPKNVSETGIVTTKKVGTLTSETCALFAPLSDESAAKEEHGNIPEMDDTVIPNPIFRDETVTLNVGGTKTLAYDLDPWYATDKAVVWSTSNGSVVSVDQKGNIEALAQGTAVITVTMKNDETKFDTVTVNVTALDLKIEGVISAQSAGLNNVSDSSTYEYVMVEGVPSFSTLKQITAPEAYQEYGLSLATSVMGRGSIWACEFGNTGNVYRIDPATGEIIDAFQPIDGDIMFGLTYSESQDTFAGIMNYNLYVDMPLTHAAEEEMLDSYDEELYEFTWHKINMLPYLKEAGGSFQTGETGQGASSEIVFSGITTIDGGMKNSYGDTFYSFSSNTGNGYYYPAQTLVLLDNVGRLWYIDEVTGLTMETDDWGNVSFFDEAGNSFTFWDEADDAFWLGYDTDGDSVEDSYSVFYIREIAETPLTNMFREGTMPRITYHFSDIEYAGETADGAPIFLLSLYDYWNNGTTNELYLLVGGVGTGEYTWDENWNRVEIKTPDRLFELGNTGAYNIIASIHYAEVTGGLEEAEEEEVVNTLGVGAYRPQTR